MTRTELEKLTKEDLITEYLDLLDDYYWYCNRFKAGERYNKILIEKINRASAIIETYTTLNPMRVREKLLTILDTDEGEDRTGDDKE